MAQPVLPRQFGIVFTSVVLLSLVWAYLRPMVQARQEMDRFSYADQTYYDDQDWDDEAGDYYEWAEYNGLLKDT